MTKNLKVLFVEDEENIRVSLKEAIGDEFQEFSTAKDGKEGLNKFLNAPFDLIISDISMPIMNGLEMVKEIRKTRDDIPIILLSAYSDREKLLEAINIGINKYMIKPVDPEELLTVVFELVKQDNLILLLKPYHFDFEKKILYHDSHIVNLTKKELLFVTLLSKSAGEIVSKEKLKSYVWKKDNSNDTLLRALVKRFRDKTDKKLVENCQGLGYKIFISE